MKARLDASADRWVTRPGLVLAPLFFLCSVWAYGQVSLPPDEQKRRQDQYLSLRRDCQVLLLNKNWERAQSTCRTLSEARGSEGFDWMIYTWVGTAHLGQKHFEDALAYFNRALESAPVKTGSAVELASVYRGVAIASHGLRNINLARQFYMQAETKLQEAEKLTGNQTVRQEFEKLLRATRQLHQLLERNATASDVEREIARQLDMGLR